MRDDISLLSKQRARALRRDPTPTERKLWSALRDRRLHTLKFRRQATLSRYIAGCLRIANELAVEVDGSPRAESRRDEGRDAWLKRDGYRVMRVWNHGLTFNQEGALATLASACGLEW